MSIDFSFVVEMLKDKYLSMIGRSNFYGSSEEYSKQENS